MGQNISNVNIDGTSLAGKAVNAYTNDKVSGAEGTSLSSGDNASDYIYSGAPSKQTKVNKTMDQFEEYLKNQQEKAKESGEDAASQEKADKEAAKEIRTNLSSEEIKQLTIMGVDMESARLSDIMGMVNTIRGKAHREETQEVFAEIKANSGDVDKLVVTGSGVKVAGTDVSVDNVSVTDVARGRETASATDTAQTEKRVSISDSEGVKETLTDGKHNVDKTSGNRIADNGSGAADVREANVQSADAQEVRVRAAAVQVNQDNTTNAADFTPGKNELVYMVRNNLPLNKDNLYKAHFSGVKSGNGEMDDATFEAISGQIAGIIEESGIEGFDMQDARFLLDNELPVNADSMRLMVQYKQIEGQSMDSVELPENDEESVNRAAEELYKKVLYVEPETVQELAEQAALSGKEVSIQAAYAYQLSEVKTAPEKTQDDKKSLKTDKPEKSDKIRWKSIGKTDVTDVADEVRHSGEEKLSDNSDIVSGMTAVGITAKKQLLEIQLSMTLQVANRMAKLDINVDTKGLSETIDILRKAERELLKESLANSGVEPTDENADMLAETIAGVEKLGDSDASVLSTVLDGGAFTVRGLNRASDAIAASEDDQDNLTAEVTAAKENFSPVNNERWTQRNRENGDAVSGTDRVQNRPADGRGRDDYATFADRTVGNQASAEQESELRQNLQRSFESVRRSYESVGTAPRSDMGDSITKAFANIDELLGELDIDVNYESRRAAKILGYNNLEINQENIDSIIGYDREVNRLMDNFYPESVMGLIKDGINPMDVSIDELNDIISEKNYNGGVTDAKNFATYLRDVEKRGEITDAERKSYIGIYRVMDKLAKSGDREAGYIFANRANLTIRNMISAMRSRRAKGMDVDVDDSFGLLEGVEFSGNRMDVQIESGFNGNAENDEVEDEIIRQLERYRELGQEVENFIQENGIEYNMSSAFAVDALLNENEGVYKLVYDAMKKLDFDDESEDDLIDRETGNMAASMAGEDVDIDPLEALEPERLLRQLGENGDLSLTYDDIRNRLTEFMYDAGAVGLITSLDISAIKSATAGVSLLGQMAKKDRYQIPVETKQGTTVVNITIKNVSDRAVSASDNSSASTLIESYMKTDNLGNLTARISLSANADGSVNVTGEFVSDNATANEALQNMTELTESFRKKLEGTLAGGRVYCDVKFGTLSSNASNAPVRTEATTRFGSSRIKGADTATGGTKSGGRVSHGTACRVVVDVVRTMTEFF